MNRVSIPIALGRGWRRTCPCCGEGAAFAGFLRIRERCAVCGEALHHHRADDAPAYLAMLVTGLVVVPALWLVEVGYRPPLVLHFVLWPLAGTALSLYLLPRFKGAVLGVQWVLRMHGFEKRSDGRSPGPEERR